MSSAQSDVAAHLVTLGLGTLGTDIFLGLLPSEPNVACSVVEYGGQQPMGGFGVTGVQYEMPSVQVVFRGEPGDFAGPYTKARTAWASLAGVQPGTFQSGVYLRIVPLQSPFLMNRDSNDRVCIACNYSCEKEP